MSRGFHEGLEEEMLLWFETEPAEVLLPVCPRTSCRMFNLFLSLISLCCMSLCMLNWEGVCLFLYGTMTGLKNTEGSGRPGSNRKDHDSTIAKFTVSSVFQKLSTLQVSFKHR